ncbi:hypothetical protein [Ferruginibacter sp. HRS2-29]|uniref:hypothetical protein n=1 Tax=Ferruginibacter sp. HRS2-29 TaxID=2487334 RepID=UPI0020CD16CB|nr:hypothetical protein [Ferruginibacter sp. HRS2-29]MCP9751758.1 hypothetical protein [Ferruginibacter sp. HRS2-29]
MITRTYFLFACSILLFASCSPDSENEKNRANSLRMSFENSTQAINYGILKTYQEFESKKNDPDYSYQAARQAGHFKAIQTESEAITKYLDSLILISDWKETDATSLFSEKYVTSIFYEKLKNYEATVFGLDSNLKKIFQKNGVIPRGKDSMVPPAVFYKTIFEYKSLQETALSLAMIKSNMKVFEDQISTYFINQIGATIERFEVFSAIIGQSSKIVKPGDDVEITAGIGAFSAAAKPKVIINGEIVAVDGSATATKKIRASGRPGKYIVPVKIEFIQPDGMKKVNDFSIEYTVADPKNF